MNYDDLVRHAEVALACSQNSQHSAAIVSALSGYKHAHQHWLDLNQDADQREQWLIESQAWEHHLKTLLDLPL